MDQPANIAIFFSRYFLRYTLYVRQLLVVLLLMIVFGGVMVSWVEHIDLGSAIYFAFITALTIGYGDITPETAWGRMVCVLIGLLGMIFTGLTIAIATQALSDSIKYLEDNDSLSKGQ